MSTLETLFKNIGLDVTEAGMSSIDTLDGIVTDEMVSNANRRLSPLKTDFGESQVVMYLFWLQLPFNPLSLKKTPKGKFFSSLSMNKTPAQIIDLMRQASTINEDDTEEDVIAKTEYKERLFSLLNVDNLVSSKKKGKQEEFKIVVDVESGACSPQTFEAFLPFFNTLNVQAPTQRFKVSTDKTITRAASLKSLPSGNIDEVESDLDLVNAYACEQALLGVEIETIERECKAKETPKTEIDTLVSNARRNRIVTRPMITSVTLCFYIPTNSSGIVDSETIAKYTSSGFDCKYAMAYDKTGEKQINQLKEIMSRSKFTNVNFLPVQRCVPIQSAEVPNIGMAHQLTTYSAVGDKNMIEDQIEDIYQKLTDSVVDNNFMDADNFKRSVSKFSPISKKEVLQCYTNNIGQYKRALDNPEVVAANQEYLKALGTTLSLSAVKGKVVEIAFTEVSKTEILNDRANEDAEVMDSEDEEALGASATTASASDFID